MPRAERSEAQPRRAERRDAEGIASEGATGAPSPRAALAAIDSELFKSYGLVEGAPRDSAFGGKTS